MSKNIRTSARLALIAFGVAAASLALPQTAAEAAGATTYYVSPAGNDSNAGTSPSAPIKTLGRASGLQLNPGDSLLLQSGATFSGKLAIWKNGTAATPITVASYGGTARPVVTGDCLEVGGSYITMKDFQVDNCTINGIWSNGTGNVITNIEATHNVQGIDIGEQAQNNKVTRNYLHNNDRMAPNTPGAFDDWGAVGMVVQGDNTEVSYNTINDNHAPSPDFGTDGSAVEIYGGIGTVVHHNTADNNETFTELGNNRSADTTFAYNQVTSSLADSEFLITRGSSDYFGPVTGTVAVNNSVKLTGANSRGYICYAGCTASLFSLYNNVLDVAGQVGNLEGTMAGGNNIYWGGSMGSAKMMAGDKWTDPKFKGSRLMPTPKSPVVDAGRPATMPTDLVGTSTDVDGNKDGVKSTDIGAFEVKAKGGAKTSKKHQAKGKHSKKSHKDSKKAGKGKKAQGHEHHARGKRH